MRAFGVVWVCLIACSGGSGTQNPPIELTIGGTVTGLLGQMTLQLDGGETLSITSDGPFTFVSPQSPGASYSVTISSNAALPNQLCSLAKASGIATSDVTDVAIDCANPAHTLASGIFHSCEVDGTGTLECWGANDAGQLGNGTLTPSDVPVIVPPEHGWSSVTAFYSATCGIKTDHTLWCWGTDLVTPGADSSPIQQGSDSDWAMATLGGGFLYAIKLDGSIWSLGADPILDGARFSTLSIQFNGMSWITASASDEAICALDPSAALWCWGNNAKGEVGDAQGATVASSPVKISAAAWSSIAGGDGYTCGIQTGGVLSCWGNYEGGNDQTLPTAIGGNWSAVAAGITRCAIDTAGALWCWGDNSEGQVEAGATTHVDAPTQIGTTTTWTDVTVGRFHICARGTSGLACQGYDLFGQLGNGTMATKLSPVEVGTEAWTDVQTLAFETCGLQPDHTLWCWGQVSMGADGFDVMRDLTPTLVSTGWQSFAFSGIHWCAVGADQSMWCWGDDSAGQLGNEEGASITPEQVGSDLDWVAAYTLDFYSSCGIRTNGTLWCWGGNDFGELGDPAAGGSSPLQIGTRTDWVALTGSNYETCALDTASRLWCWGMGIGQSAEADTPVQIGTATWNAIARGADSVCGIESDGSLWCWGYNVDGEVGDGTTTTRTIPVQIGSATSWRSIAVGDADACGTQSDGTLWCWGANDFGQVGDGSQVERQSPTQVGTSTTWARIVPGARCALQTDDTVWCWGDNQLGQVGTGDTVFNSLQPVQL